MEQGVPEQRSLYDLLLANRPGLTTPEIFAIHRGIDVVLGLLLIANLLRTTGVYFGENGGMSFSISGPLITRPLLEAIFGPSRGATLELGSERGSGSA
ncbi:MAG: hypothetical protein ACM3XZ_03050 [Betaproteobacteria bacterium]